jgi:hypothetical protein
VATVSSKRLEEFSDFSDLEKIIDRRSLGLPLAFAGL